MARLSRECIITEKIDGTNGQIFIWDEAYCPPLSPPSILPTAVGAPPGDVPFLSVGMGVHIAAGSKNRWVVPGKQDNMGFAAWVYEHAKPLSYLGHGRHFGEWWGNGIQRGYGLPKGDKRFSLFNVNRWEHPLSRPGCCGIVPVIWRGGFDSDQVKEELSILAKNGSYAVPGFMNPEGVVVFHTAANFCFKKTIENDEVPKSKIEGEIDLTK